MLLFIVEIVCGLFECKRICASFIVSFVFPCFAMRGHIFKDWMHQIPFTALAPPYIDIYQHTGPECHGHFRIQWFEVRDDFRLCWYRWNSCPSLFIFLFIILTSTMIKRYDYIIFILDIDEAKTQTEIQINKINKVRVDIEMMHTQTIIQILVSFFLVTFHSYIP